MKTTKYMYFWLNQSGKNDNKYLNSSETATELIVGTVEHMPKVSIYFDIKRSKSSLIL